MIPAILKIIDEGQRFLVVSHEGPDGDAIGSTLALTLALKAVGKDVVAMNQDRVPKDFDFLPGSAQVVRELPAGVTFDAGFVLDAGELRRAGEGLREACRILINIDHHPESEDFGEVYFVDDRASATGALVYRLLKAGGMEINTAVAACIYTAILSDTGSFRYSNADPEAFAIAGEMVACGVDPWEIASGLYESQEARRLQLLGRALQTLAVSDCGRYASITVTSDMFDGAEAGPEHTDRFVNYPRSVRGVEVAIFFRQAGACHYKVGFRSKGLVDVGALARGLGGGGHHNAAGAMVAGDLDSVRRQVFDLVDGLLS